MKFEEMALARQSVRAYSDKIVETEKLEKICDVARNSPSSCNSQPWVFHIFNKDSKDLNAVKESCKIANLNKFLDQVNSLIVVEQSYGNKRSRKASFLTGNDFNSMDIGMVVDHICLEALELGLGTCIIGAFNKFKLKRAMHLKLNQRIRLVIAVGYPVENAPIRKKSRKSFDDLVVKHF